MAGPRKIDSSGADSPIATATSTERSLIADRADVSSSTELRPLVKEHLYYRQRDRLDRDHPRRPTALRLTSTFVDDGLFALSKTIDELQSASGWSIGSREWAAK
jgi:hypothetical protein